MSRHFHSSLPLPLHTIYIYINIRARASVSVNPSRHRSAETSIRRNHGDLLDGHRFFHAQQIHFVARQERIFFPLTIYRGHRSL